MEIHELLFPSRTCPDCGASNWRGSTYCHSCGERIRNRNPVARFFVTVVAMAALGGICTGG